MYQHLADQFKPENEGLKVNEQKQIKLSISEEQQPVRFISGSKSEVLGDPEVPRHESEVIRPKKPRLKISDLTFVNGLDSFGLPTHVDPQQQQKYLGQLQLLSSLQNQQSKP